MRSLATISLCTIQDPLEIIFSSKIVYSQYDDRLFSTMIVERDALDGLFQMVQIGPKVVRRWSEGGPGADAIMVILGTMQKCELFYWLADWLGNELFQSEQ